MSKLRDNIRTGVRRGNSIPATIIDTNGNRASAQLAGRGAIYRNLEVIGGPARMGDQCHVDLTTPEPTIVMTSKTWLTADDLKLSLQRMPQGTGGGGNGGTGEALDIDKIWVFSSLAGATSYSRDGAGFTAALTNYVSGDKVIIPAGIITGTFTLPAGVEVFGMGRHNTSIVGQVTGADGASINDLAVEYSTTSASLTYAVLGPTSGNFKIDHCIVVATNAGSGSTYGVWQPRNGHTDIDYSTLRGECSGGGLGYAAGMEA
jgi:hypothetical protein